MPAVGTADGGDRVFVNKKLAGEDMPVTAFLFVTFSDSRLHWERDL